MFIPMFSWTSIKQLVHNCDFSCTIQESFIISVNAAGKNQLSRVDTAATLSKRKKAELEVFEKFVQTL